MMGIQFLPWPFLFGFVVFAIASAVEWITATKPIHMGNRTGATISATCAASFLIAFVAMAWAVW